MSNELPTKKELKAEAPIHVQESPTLTVDQRQERIKSLLDKSDEFKTDRLLTMQETGFTAEDVKEALGEYIKKAKKALGESAIMQKALEEDGKIIGMLEDAKQNNFHRLFQVMQGDSPVSLAKKVRERVAIRIKQEEDEKIAGFRLAIGPTKKSKPAVDVTSEVDYLRALQHQARGQFEGSGEASPEALRMAEQAGKARAAQVELSRATAQEEGRNVAESGGLINLEELKRQEALAKAEAFLVSQKALVERLRREGKLPSQNA